MRVVFLNPVGSLGGAERSLLTLLASLRASQPSWDLHLISGQAGPLAAAAELSGISVHILPFPLEVARMGDAGMRGSGGLSRNKILRASTLVLALSKIAKYLLALRRLLRTLEPTIVHSNGFKMHVLGAWAKTSGSHLIWHIHDYVGSRPVMRTLMRLHSWRCSGVIANSASVAQDVRRVCGGALKIHKLWNAIDLAEFSSDGPTLNLDSLCGLPSPERPVLRVGLLGTFARWKGHQVFLRALGLLPPDVAVRGYVIGGPLYQTDDSQWHMEDLREMASRFGLNDRVGFTGFVNRPAEAIRALDIVVHASTEPEPFGLVIIEAMACARPVITSNWGGSTEITDGNSGALAHVPGDAASLADRILQLARDRGLVDRLGLAGRSHAEKYFDRVCLGPRCAAIYQSLLNAGTFTTEPLVASPESPC